MKRRLSILFISLLILVSLCACGGKVEEDTNNELDTNYSTTIYVCGSWGNFEALDAAALLFNEKYPNIEIVYNSLDQYTNDLQNRFVSGENIDIYTIDWLLSNDDRYTYFWEHALDLNGLLNFDNTSSEYLQTGVIDGKQIAVPIYASMYGLMVNEDLLAKYDLEVPTNYKEFKECLDTLKNNGLYPILEANKEYIAHVILSEVFLEAKNSSDVVKYVDNLLEGKDETGVMEDVVEKLSELETYIHPDSYNLEDSYNSAILRFFEGDIAFVPYYTSYFSGTKKREAKSETFSASPFTYSLIASPCDEGYVRVNQQLSTFYMAVYDEIDEEKLPYVLEFLQFLIDDVGSETLSEVKNMPTANINVGDNNFPYLKDLSADQIVYAGINNDDDALLKLNQFTKAFSLSYVESDGDLNREELMSSTVKRLSE